MGTWFALIWLPHPMGTWDKSSIAIPKTEPTIGGLLPIGRPSSPRLQTILRLGNTATKREGSPGLETGEVHLCNVLLSAVSHWPSDNDPGTSFPVLGECSGGVKGLTRTDHPI